MTMEQQGGETEGPSPDGRPRSQKPQQPGGLLPAAKATMSQTRARDQRPATPVARAPRASRSSHTRAGDRQHTCKQTGHVECSHTGHRQERHRGGQGATRGRLNGERWQPREHLGNDCRRGRNSRHSGPGVGLGLPRAAGLLLLAEAVSRLATTPAQTAVRAPGGGVAKTRKGHFPPDPHQNPRERIQNFPNVA